MDHAVQTFGGAGYMRETEINRLYRASKYWRSAPVPRKFAA
jgi:alkylation response protein AidB-like acyl-CoA dehydrogenase